jgi:hypothetical protein
LYHLPPELSLSCHHIIVFTSALCIDRRLFVRGFRRPMSLTSREWSNPLQVAYFSQFRVNACQNVEATVCRLMNCQSNLLQVSSFDMR